MGSLTAKQLRAQLARYFEAPVPAEQLAAIEARWAAIEADPEALWSLEEALTDRLAAEPFHGQAWFEELADRSRPTPLDLFATMVVRDPALPARPRARPFCPDWLCGSWSLAQGPTGDARRAAPSPPALWQLDRAGTVRTRGDPAHDGARWRFHLDPAFPELLILRSGGRSWSRWVVMSRHDDGSFVVAAPTFTPSRIRWRPAAGTELEEPGGPAASEGAGELPAAPTSRPPRREGPASSSPAPRAREAAVGPAAAPAPLPWPPVPPFQVRSLEELRFLADELPCEHCAGRGVERLHGTLARGACEMMCVECRRWRSFAFVPFEQPRVQPFTLAPGTTPSRALGPEPLRAIADRELARVAADPAGYTTLADHAAARRHLLRARVALAELQKHRPDDAGVRREVANARALWARLEASRSLVEARPGALPRPTSLHQRVQQHRAWLKRGRRGDGQLVLRDEELSDARLDSALLHAAHIERTVLREVDLSYAELDDATLRHTRLLACNLTRCQLEQASLEECDLSGSSLTLALLGGLQAHGGDWGRIGASRSDWTRARIVGVDLREADLTDSILDGAAFERCDLRGADLGRRDVHLRNLGTARAARFLACDLRGARLEGLRIGGAAFDGCLLEGLVGVAVVEGGATVDGRPWGSSP